MTTPRCCLTVASVICNSAAICLFNQENGLTVEAHDNVMGLEGGGLGGAARGNGKNHGAARIVSWEMSQNRR